MTSLVQDAHQLGLSVHPYMLRAGRLPRSAKDFDYLLKLFLIKAGVDGVLTDFSDLALP
ncbi:TPA: hypothetical protein EYN98_05350 [Candidatus Poribacteria bacterium]|nr:hypothetical protein [Candidatus Poribacteria bacterium]HIA65481.1 hypothetical protein [Candidatus Poribacteria bacterium]HIB89267.1 hypothetical protein [Candidatus Poribacteria bacterium]HIB99064.1 hypothetical protein [Candidatus Poribacteria bacterium]HIM12500.1 hypothetical protein [Candidatus Poribacteria bacterium]